MNRISPILLVLIALSISPLLAQDPPPEPPEVAAAREKVVQAEETVYAAEEEMEKIFLELEQDFELIVSDKWAGLSSDYVDAIEVAIGKWKENEGSELAEEIELVGIFSNSGAKRLGAAVSAALAEAMGTPDAQPKPEEVLATAVKAVFPGETFADCWDAAFQDLPEVVKYRGTQEALGKAEKALEAAETAAKGDPNAPPGCVLIPRGRFEFGPWAGWDMALKSNKASKVRQDAFYIGVTEVTNRQFARFLEGLTEKDRERFLAFGFKLLEGGKVAVPVGQADHPVREITFEAATRYAATLKLRLPTEQEWEMAARGLDGRLFPWGNDWDKDAANWSGTGLGRPTSVGACPKDVSPFGVKDMAGNVSELTSTLSGGKPAPTQFRRLKSTDSVIYRGGNFKEGRESAQTTYRWTLTAISGKEPIVGFRIAISEKAWKKR